MSSGNTEINFLEGPRSRWEEFKFTIRVLREFVRGFRALHFSGPCVTIFGSARFKESHPYYTHTRRIAGEIAKLGFTIITGGGPGLMEAANRGAKDVSGKSIGCNIELPKEQEPNPYLDKQVTIRYFFIRKVLLVKYSYAFVVMPGGFGTLDELFEALTLIQTNKIHNFPVIIFCKDFYDKLMEHMRLMQQSQTISAQDLSLYLYTDSVEEAVAFIREKSIEKFGLKARKPSRWFFER